MIQVHNLTMSVIPDFLNRGSRFSASVLASYYLADLLEELDCGVSAPRDESLLFRQKEPKPCLPVRDPAGPWSTTPNQDGSETRCAQTVFARKVGFGAPAQPRPTRLK